MMLAMDYSLLEDLTSEELKKLEKYELPSGMQKEVSDAELDQLEEILGADHPDMQLLEFGVGDRVLSQEFDKTLLKIRAGRHSKKKLFDFDRVPHHAEPQAPPKPRGPLYEGMGHRVDVADKPPVGLGEVTNNKDGTTTVTGFYAFVAAPVPMLIAFCKLLTAQQRTLFATVLGFAFFILASPVVMTAKPAPETLPTAVFHWTLLALLPIFLALWKLNNSYAARGRTWLFWLGVSGHLYRYSMFLVFGFW